MLLEDALSDAPTLSRHGPHGLRRPTSTFFFDGTLSLRHADKTRYILCTIQESETDNHTTIHTRSKRAANINVYNFLDYIP